MPGVTPINIIAQQAAVIGAKKALSILFPKTKGSFGVGVSGGAEFLPAGAIEFDATLSETHVGNAEVTRHPVEVGSDISDHVRRLPEQVTLNGIVTNTPILFLASLRESPRRAEEAYEKIKELKDAGALVSVVTSLREYANMAITGFSVTRDARTGQVLNATVDFTEVLTAALQTVDVPEPAEGVPSKKAPTNRGGKPPTAAAAGKAQKVSILKSGVSAALGK